MNTGLSDWKWRRTILQSAFHPNVMTNLPSIVAKSTMEAIVSLRGTKLLVDNQAEKEGKEVDIHTEMYRITGKVIFRLIFGHDLDYSQLGGLDNIKKLFLEMTHFLIAVVMFPILQYMPFLPIYRKAFAAKERLVAMTKKAISEAITDLDNGKEGEGLIYEILKRGSGMIGDLCSLKYRKIHAR